MPSCTSDNYIAGQTEALLGRWIRKARQIVVPRMGRGATSGIHDVAGRAGYLTVCETKPDNRG